MPVFDTTWIDQYRKLNKQAGYDGLPWQTPYMHMKSSFPSNYGDLGMEHEVLDGIKFELYEYGMNVVDVMHTMFKMIDVAAEHPKQFELAIKAQIAYDSEQIGPNVGGHAKIMKKEIEQLTKLLELVKNWMNMAWEM